MNQVYSQYCALMKERRFTEAAALADRQSISEENSGVFWLTKLSAALRDGGDSVGALRAAEQAYVTAPGNVWAALVRAEALLKLGRYEEASGFFQDACGDRKTVNRARWGILFCLSKLHHWDQILEMIAQWDMPLYETHRWRTKALAGMGRSEDASAECEAWLTLNPDNAEALWIQAELWVEKEGLDATIKRFSRFTKIPGKPVVYGEIHAYLCKRAGRTDDALIQYGKLLDKQVSTAIQRKQAFVLAQSGRETEAIPLLEELLRRKPSDVYLNNGYIGACTRTSDPERAWKFYQELLKMHPGEKTIFNRLARIRKLIEKSSPPKTDINPG